MGKSPTPDREPTPEQPPPAYSPYVEPRLAAELGDVQGTLPTFRQFRN